MTTIFNTVGLLTATASPSNPTQVEIREAGRIIIDGVDYDYREAEDYGETSWQPSDHLTVLRDGTDWDITVYMFGDPAPASAKAEYEDSALPVYPIWPGLGEGESYTPQTIGSTDSTSLTAKSNDDIAKEYKSLVTELAFLYDDGYHGHWPDSNRRATTESWGERWVGYAWRQAEAFETAPDATTKATMQAAYDSALAEISIGIRTWYRVHVQATWAGAEATRILYRTDTDTGGFAATGSVVAADQAQWDDWKAAYSEALIG